MGWSQRTTSLGTKLAMATVVVLSLVSLFLYQQLTSRERDHLLSSKTRAANMVTELFAASLGAPLDFGDAEAVEVELANLKTNSEITDASVWSASSKLLSRVRPHRAPAEAQPKAPPEKDGMGAIGDRVAVTRNGYGRHG